RNRDAVALLAVATLSAACSRGPGPASDAGALPGIEADAAEPPPKLLYLPDGEVRAPTGTPPAPETPPAPAHRCPPEMVDVRGELCIDRWEVSLVDVAQSREFSPFYPPARDATKRTRSAWESLRMEMGPESAHAVPLPVPPAWQLAENVEPRAVSRA